MPYRHRTTVRFSDTDALGHVNHARFLTYLEDARLAFFTDVMADAGVSGELMQRGVIVARVEVDYLRPLFPRREPVEVSVRVERIGQRSFTLGYTIVQEGHEAARGRSVVVAYDYGTGRSRELTPSERSLLGRHATPAGGSPEPAA